MRHTTFHLGGDKGIVTPENLDEALQQAIEIEIATIPTYLYTYYSIIREPDQNQIINYVKGKLSNVGLPEQELDAIVLDISAKIMVYANKAGALIMSVVIEEMLHMALSSNVKQSVCSLPDLVDKSPEVWPAFLPGHDPDFPINLAKFTQDQLVTFLKIESPFKLRKGSDLLSNAIEYTTIGEFYGQIKKCLEEFEFKYQVEKPQLVPGKGYYAHENIDTVYYNKNHKTQFTNQDGANEADLVHVINRQSALEALDIIVEQGEGNEGDFEINKQVLNGLLTKIYDLINNHKESEGIKSTDVSDGSQLAGYMIQAIKNLAERNEGDLQGKLSVIKNLQKAVHAVNEPFESHFGKFLELYYLSDEIQRFQNSFKAKFNIPEFDLESFYVLNFPDNPKTSDYPAVIQKLSNLLNAIYSYIFIMTQECYKKDGNTQYEIFMFGIHKSMIFILNSLCGEISSLQFTDKEGKIRTVAPTFENYPFSAASSPKSQIISLYNEAVASFNNISYIEERIHDLPNISLEPYQETATKGSLFS
ncbi:ferritin-like domain-containing protein [Aureibacter tunicatorum]|uniref:Iminophenyl-pyruvate dimer synthase domain-containing protein n=1 Tax=Aureibacter tunicatorum TaxID=866807 RepID=A0AAE4BQY3_9BACT|nr:ferritin-like domain-containing protein [Aureibacter tunicatorum]MDR6239664.1 hypothetical protein [Aureibacter tunicatorum]BDD04140.1 hypothetical protein AUTU_16230 [Aureibacter tunicatorum]